MIWCGTEICEERAEGGAAVAKRYFDQGVEFVTGTNAGTYYYAQDHLGSVRELVDTNGAVRARYDYDPWGRRTKLSGDLDADFGFTTHYYHEPSGLVLAPYRAYSPELGRWLSRDPIERLTGGFAELLPEGPNIYAYVYNNPLNEIDESGLGIISYFKCLWKMRKWQKKCMKRLPNCTPCMSNSEYIDCLLERRQAIKECMEGAKEVFEECMDATRMPPVGPRPRPKAPRIPKGK